MPQPKERVRSVRVDWADLEKKYINSDQDLFTFSRECTKNPEHPTLGTLRDNYYKAQWGRKRAARQEADKVEAIGKSAALKSEVVHFRRIG